MGLANKSVVLSTSPSRSEGSGSYKQWTRIPLISPTRYLVKKPAQMACRMRNYCRLADRSARRAFRSSRTLCGSSSSGWLAMSLAASRDPSTSAFRASNSGSISCCAGPSAAMSSRVFRIAPTTKSFARAPERSAVGPRRHPSACQYGACRLAGIRVCAHSDRCSRTSRGERSCKVFCQLGGVSQNASSSRALRLNDCKSWFDS